MAGTAGGCRGARQVLIVDDDADFAESLAEILEAHAYAPVIADRPDAALAAVERHGIAVAMLDIRLGITSGVDLLSRLTAPPANLICVMMTAHVDTETAIRALRNGAYDYFDKSREPRELLAVLDRCFEKLQLQEEKEAAVAALRRAKEEAEAASGAKSEFLATMSHELRTPLNAVIGFSEIMMSEAYGPLGNPRYLGYAKDIHDSGSHLLGLINDILDLSKAEAGKLDLVEEIVDVGEIVEAAIRLMRVRAEAAGLSFSARVPDDLPGLRGDRRKIRQILLNLLSNAVKFTPAGGVVELEASLTAKSGLVIAVRDTGIGVAKEHIPKILEPFEQVDSSLSRRAQGTGLGLPLALKMMELHQGTLTIESDLGRGTVVEISFPAQRVLSAAAAA